MKLDFHRKLTGNTLEFNNRSRMRPQSNNSNAKSIWYTLPSSMECWRGEIIFTVMKPLYIYTKTYRAKPSSHTSITQNWFLSSRLELSFRARWLSPKNEPAWSAVYLSLPSSSTPVFGFFSRPRGRQKIAQNRARKIARCSRKWALFIFWWDYTFNR